MCRARDLRNKAAQGCMEAMHRSRPPRAQLRYAEDRQHLGPVARGADGRMLWI